MTIASRRNVLFVDLDGTLTDPAEGIVGCFRFALTAMGRPAPPDADLGWIIGPPLRRSLAKMLGGADGAEEALAVYRSCYGSTGLFEASVYDGAPEALARLKDSGAHLFLCTSKPAVYASRILERFGLAAKTINMPNDATVEDLQGRLHALVAARPQGERPLARRLETVSAAQRPIGRDRRRGREGARDADRVDCAGARRAGRRKNRRAGDRAGRAHARARKTARPAHEVPSPNVGSTDARSPRCRCHSEPRGALPVAQGLRRAARRADGRRPRTSISLSPGFDRTSPLEMTAAAPGALSWPTPPPRTVAGTSWFTDGGGGPVGGRGDAGPFLGVRGARRRPQRGARAGAHR